ncbi:MAG: antitoxin [Candidatus Tokpelaia sp.]|nr:MAG: antitoxin [Candidatus Tokpelaia sp.]KAA6206167.1 MAG: antitoxin [Candidatus Tokpelaia sp.]
MPMIDYILTEKSAHLSDLRNNLKKITEKGEAVAILSRNKPVFYAVPLEVFENMLEQLDDMQLGKVIKKRRRQPSVKVSIDDL